MWRCGTEGCGLEVDWTVLDGLDDIKGIFQPKLFYDALSSRVYSAALGADAISKHHL